MPIIHTLAMCHLNLSHKGSLSTKMYVFLLEFFLSFCKICLFFLFLKVWRNGLNNPKLRMHNAHCEEKSPKKRKKRKKRKEKSGQRREGKIPELG